MIIAAFVLIGCIVAIATAIALKHDEKEIAPLQQVVELDQASNELNQVYQ